MSGLISLVSSINHEYIMSMVKNIKGSDVWGALAHYLVSSGSLGHDPPKASSQPQLQHKYLSKHRSLSPPT